MSKNDPQWRMINWTFKTDGWVYFLLTLWDLTWGTYGGRQRRRDGGIAAERHRGAEMLFAASTGDRPRQGRPVMDHGTGRGAPLDDAVRPRRPAVCRRPARSRGTSSMTQSAPVTRHSRRSLGGAPHSTYHFLQQRRTRLLAVRE